VAVNAGFFKFLMSSCNFEIGLVMVELGDLVKAHRRMAARTGLSYEFVLELVLVHRRVTARAEVRVIIAIEFEVMGRLSHLDEGDGLLGREVATPARLHVFVSTDELETGGVVIKSGPGIELNGRMAGRARLLVSLRRELLLMRGRMAVDAKILLKARKFINVLALDLVTGLAAYLLMRPG
jgi:hypothetical protein